MSLFNVLGFAAVEEANRRIATMRASSSVETDSADTASFSTQVQQANDAFSSSESMGLRALTAVDIESLYQSVRAEADDLFSKFSEAYRTLSREGRTPTRQNVLLFISKTHSTIQFTQLNSNQIHSLIDFYLDYSDVEDNEIIDNRLSPRDREAAEEQYAEILLEAIIMSQVLKSRNKFQKRIKKERKDEARRVEKEEREYVAELEAQKKRLNESRQRKQSE